MDGQLLSALSPDEQDSLALCGITRDVQLARNSAAALWRDLEESRKLFPNKVCPITRETLERLCRQAAEAYPEETVALPPEKPAPEEKSDGLRLSHHSRSYPHFHPMRRSRSSRSQRSSGGEQASGSKGSSSSRRHDHSRCIHGRHSLATWLGAWATLLLVADLAAFIWVPISVFIGVPLPFGIQECGIIALVCALPWLCFVGSARCAVCSMKAFSFRRYIHSKAAHRLPLLGTVIPTALHVIFLGWYRCPACGTPQKLFRSRKRS